MKFSAAIVVGASSGIGAEIVRQLASEGCKVAAVARREERLREIAGKGVLTFVHDVTCYNEVPALFQEITKQLGGLDLVVYAAGVMPDVGWHEYDFAKDRRIVEVNLLGAIAWLDQAAIRFENTHSGAIVGIGSVAGDRGRAGQPVYNTSKAALATYLEALRNRLSRYGVKVATVKPGPTLTEMTAHLHLRGALEPSQVARFVLQVAGKSGEFYVKRSHKFVFAVLRNIPSWIFRRLKI